MASKIPANSSLPGINKQSGKNMGFEVKQTQTLMLNLSEPILSCKIDIINLPLKMAVKTNKVFSIRTSTYIFWILTIMIIMGWIMSPQKDTLKPWHQIPQNMTLFVDRVLKK